MRQRALSVVAMVALAACSVAPEGATTTMGPTSTSTSTTASTTTTAPTTTTTTLPPTTTTTLLEGNWADQPVITSSLWVGVLGWWDGSMWVQATAGMDLPIGGGEDYQVALLGTISRTTGGTRETACDVHPDLDMPGLQLADPDLLAHPLVSGEDSVVEGVAISAGWNLTPSHVGDGEAHPDLEAIGIGLLAERGFETERPPMVQTVDADLEGDGAIETIVVIEDTEMANEASGVFSLVFVVSPARDAPMVVDESIITADESGYPESFRVSAVADLSGDGIMEVVLDRLAWEYSGVTVHELTDDGFERRLGAGCGV